MFKRRSPEELAAKRAYVARGKSVQSGAVQGLLEKIPKWSDEALPKRRQSEGAEIWRVTHLLGASQCVSADFSRRARDEENAPTYVVREQS